MGLKSFRLVCLVTWLAFSSVAAQGKAETVSVASPSGRNVLTLNTRDDSIDFRVARDGRVLFGPSPLGPKLAEANLLDGVRIVEQKAGEIDDSFPLYWGKTDKVANRCSTSRVTLTNESGVKWQVDLRAYDDGVAFRYRILQQDGLHACTVAAEVTEFEPVGKPTALFNVLESFTTSHETVYEKKSVGDVPVRQLMDCPLLIEWPNGPAAAITEARVRYFAGMYLERQSQDSPSLHVRLSPLHKGDDGKRDGCVFGETPIESPWRVVLLADQAGDLLESNLLLCLNDPPGSEYAWAKPGKSTFHWWYGEFEDDHKLPNQRETFVARHCRYIDFCADNNIAYHAISGDGFAWYKQSRIEYGIAAEDADCRVARPELGFPEIFAYAKKRGVGIRLWVHWKALDKHMEEALATYEKWGVKGLMVDFLDRDDQQMLVWVDRMLDAAARHKIHIQIHGSSKYSGEQRTYPNLFNREGVLNLEYSKWSKLCTPAHAVNVAYTRALAGPVDYHLGGLRCKTREEFQPIDRAPNVMGTRSHHLALYVVYENPMPMVADGPHVYEGMKAFDFIRVVPETWDETRFVVGEAGEYVVVARRKGKDWFVAGITNWTGREVRVPLAFLADGNYEATSWLDGANADRDPNELRTNRENVTKTSHLDVKMATGGGFVSIIRPR